MEELRIINNTIKVFFISVILYFVYIKITNYNKNTIKKTIFILIVSIMNSILYTFLVQYSSTYFIMGYIYICYIIILNKIIKNELTYFIVAIILSFSITYIIHLLSVIVSGVVLKLFFSNISYNSYISLFVIPVIFCLLTYFIFRIKRLKYGFNFLKNSSKVKDIGKILMILGGVIIIFFNIYQIDVYRNINYDTFVFTFIFILTVIIIIAFYFCIKSQITQKYKENMKNRTIEIQNQEILEQQNQINELKETNLKMATVIHKYNNRFNALENAIITSIENTKSETSSELGIMLEDLKQMSKQFSGEIIKNTKNKNTLPLTNIISIDNIFKYMSLEADKNNIKFDLKINNSINYLIEKIIKKEDLETLIGDHIKDAIIAINSSNNKSRKIMCILGIVDNCYELCIYDTGINFEIETLLKLGTKMITTHKNDGGSGIGFITTFDTLRKCKGSIIIEEYDSEENYYTKSITFRFDGKKEYKIRSYRVEQIKSNSHYANRIILEKV